VFIPSVVSSAPPPSARATGRHHGPARARSSPSPKRAAWKRSVPARSVLQSGLG